LLNKGYNVERRRLTDILIGSEPERLRQAWDKTKAAEEFKPLPGGTYAAHIIGGELFQSKTKGTPGYKLTFKVCEGDYAGRQFWSDLWLSEAALPMAKRDLGKLGVTSLDQLERPLPEGICVKAKVTLRKEDDGTEYNRVRSFEVVGIDKPEPDAFAPADPPTDQGGGPSEAGATPFDAQLAELSKGTKAESEAGGAS
jgi:hypothetical protein